MIPDAGDIHWIDFGETRGTEQAGRRPALIVSMRSFNERSTRVVACPITSRLLTWPVVVLLPPSVQVRGVILCDQIRAIDRRTRVFAFIERLPEPSLAAVRAVLDDILGL